MDEVVEPEWVSAAATRNFRARNPLVDWLNLYGTHHGFKQDDELPGYDPRTDFTNFILSQSVAFEAAVTRTWPPRFLSSLSAVILATSVVGKRPKRLPRP